MKQNMKLQLEIPGIDTEVLEKQALESATKGALSEIRDFYEGHNSPYRTMLRKSLESQSTGNSCFKLPNVTGLINSAISAEIDRIVNNAVANTYLPMITEILTGAAKEMKLSEILDMIRGGIHSDDEFHAKIAKHHVYDWYDLKIQTGKYDYETSLHEHLTEKGKYHLLSMPYRKNSVERTMKFHLGNKNKYIEMPFEANIANDEVAIVCAKLLIADTVIDIDFNGEYYPEDED
ncbi:MAG: hypothetical protein LBR26_16075 [Prevotella sp.]|jgi:hypothetical protein|nr:hypothetical protein [Prevotella sp.]